MRGRPRGLARVLVAAAAPGRAARARHRAAAAAPVNVTLPQVSGLARVGGQLRASPGSWSGSPSSYAYEWLRCNPLGAACTAIAGAGSPTHAVAALDLGHTLRVSVVASNSAG